MFASVKSCDPSNFTLGTLLSPQPCVVTAGPNLEMLKVSTPRLKRSLLAVVNVHLEHLLWSIQGQRLARLHGKIWFQILPGCGCGSTLSEIIMQVCIEGKECSKTPTCSLSAPEPHTIKSFQGVYYCPLLFQHPLPPGLSNNLSPSKALIGAIWRLTLKLHPSPGLSGRCRSSTFLR